MSKVYSQLNNFNTNADFSNFCSSFIQKDKSSQPQNQGLEIFQDTSCLADSVETRHSQSSISNSNEKNDQGGQTRVKSETNISFSTYQCPHAFPQKINKITKSVQNYSYNCTFEPNYSTFETQNDDDNRLTYELKLKNSGLEQENINEIQKVLDVQDNSSKINKEFDSLELMFDKSIGISKELYALAKAHSPEQIFTNVYTLNKRKSFFGIRKSLKEIITFQDSSITTNSILTLDSKEESQQAVRHFSILYHQICLKKDTYDPKQGIQFEKKEELDKEQNMKILVLQYLIQFGQKKSRSFINELFTQVIKQIRNNKQLIQVFELINYLKCLLYSYCPSDKILLTLLHVLLFEIPQQKIWYDMEPAIRQINTVLPYILRRFEDENYKYREYIGEYFLSKQIVEAIVYNKQITIPIFFSTGSILFIPVEHYQTFYDLKTNILKELKLNSTRFYEDQFIIYDIEKEKDSLNRQISLDNEYVWDILNKWDSTLCKKKVKLDEDFFQFFMIKSLLPFEIKGEDPIPTMFNFSQIFYEVYTIYTNYIVELEKTIKMLAFLQNVIKDEDISKEMPIYFTDQQRNQILPEVQKIYFKIKDKYSVIQSKINYLEIAKDSIFYDATEISVQYSFAQNDKDFESTSIVLKPTSFLVLSQDQLSHKQYFYKDIQQISHNNNKKTLIKMKDESTHYIMSDKSFQIEFLIQKYQNLISNNQLNSFDHNSLKEIKME